MSEIILFRKDIDTESELKIASEYLHVTETRVGLRHRLVVGRYSVLPFYKELENDLESQGSKLINSFSQHQYIADFGYYHDVKDFTPKTYFELTDLPPGGGPYVVKGRTNSRKIQWATKMFARNNEEAINISCELSVEDPLIMKQGTIVREFAKLEVPEVGINGMPFANEWRFFFLGRHRLAYGYYWSIAEKKGEMDEEGLAFAKKMALIVSPKVHFVAIDIAKTVEGKWILIEINDGQMSGLSDCDPATLYGNLSCFLPQLQLENHNAIRHVLDQREALSTGSPGEKG